ncbi:MAG TPA: cytochrome-c oxidase, cbb3-type subunit III [Rhodocyclaceae bacterium]|nr:cytochrome-c oxidase, cbb3-type subunit III [Rhodocyclaceae bacterium]
MSEEIPSFWNIYITVIVLLSVIGCGIFLWVQDSAKNNAGQTMGHVWDETLEEYDNPLPNWWRWLFYLTVVFSLAYLVLYPGLGSYTGMFGWTSRGQYDKEIAEAKAKYDPIYDAYLKQDIVSLSKDAKAREIGKMLFLINCIQCHGSDAKGTKGFPNLTDSDWLYGGTPEQIETTILDGRNGMMPPYGGNPEAVGGASGARELAHYVRSLSGLPSDSILADKGKDRYFKVCFACHGPEGKGNQAMGAPNLTDKAWLYGSREDAIVETITKGRSNQMPEHRMRLGEAKVHLLAAYVYGLGGGVIPDGK